MQCANTKPTPPRRTRADTWAQPDAVSAGHCGARLAVRFKRPQPEIRLWHPARRPRIESPGHWVKVGAGTRAQTRSQGGWVTTPVSGPPPPRGPLRPGRGLKVSFPFRAGSHRGVAAIRGYTAAPPRGIAQRGGNPLPLRGGPPSLAPRPRVGGPPFPDIPPWRPHVSPPLTLPSRVTQSARARTSCLTSVWARAGGGACGGGAQVSGCRGRRDERAEIILAGDRKLRPQHGRAQRSVGSWPSTVM